MYKKIYVEITNICQLSCSFCKQDNRPKKNMTVIEFELILKQIKPLTNYIYLHVKGEPLLHPNLQEILDIALKYDMKVNITTNGVNLLKQAKLLSEYKNIYQINVSLHSYNQNKIFDNNYFTNIFEATTYLLTNSQINISYRLWDSDLVNNKKIIESINNYFNLNNLQAMLIDKSIKLMNHLYLNKENHFIWPSLNNCYSNKGPCLGLTSHFGILVDGTVVPCCLDDEGIIKLGNIFEKSITDILHTKLALDIKNGFKNNKRICELCQKCHF